MSRINSFGVSLLFLFGAALVVSRCSPLPPKPARVAAPDDGPATEVQAPADPSTVENRLRGVNGEIQDIRRELAEIRVELADVRRGK